MPFTGLASVRYPPGLPAKDERIRSDHRPTAGGRDWFTPPQSVESFAQCPRVTRQNQCTRWRLRWRACPERGARRFYAQPGIQHHERASHAGHDTFGVIARQLQRAVELARQPTHRCRRRKTGRRPQLARRHRQAQGLRSRPHQHWPMTMIQGRYPEGQLHWTRIRGWSCNLSIFPCQPDFDGGIARTGNRNRINMPDTPMIPARQLLGPVNPHRQVAAADRHRPAALLRGASGSNTLAATPGSEEWRPGRPRRASPSFARREPLRRSPAHEPQSHQQCRSW